MGNDCIPHARLVDLRRSCIQSTWSGSNHMRGRQQTQVEACKTGLELNDNLEQALQIAMSACDLARLGVSDEADLAVSRHAQL